MSPFLSRDESHLDSFWLVNHELLITSYFIARDTSELFRYANRVSLTPDVTRPRILPLVECERVVTHSSYTKISAIERIK